MEIHVCLTKNGLFFKSVETEPRIIESLLYFTSFFETKRKEKGFFLNFPTIIYVVNDKALYGIGSLVKDALVP